MNYTWTFIHALINSCTCHCQKCHKSILDMLSLFDRMTPVQQWTLTMMLSVGSVMIIVQYQHVQGSNGPVYLGMMRRSMKPDSKDGSWSKWRKSEALCDRELYIKQKNCVTLVIQTAKRRFYTDTFLTSNPKSLYTTLNSLLGTGSQQSPRQVDDNLKLSNDFADYLDDKIAKIRLSLEKSATSAIASPGIVPVRSTSLDSSENNYSITDRV